jgi:carboxymethylenebutenolidase
MALGEYTTQDVQIPRPSGRPPCDAYFAHPTSERNMPGVVVIHEMYGLNDNIRDVARRFAAEGYAAVAVDLFSGGPRAICMAKVVTGMLARPYDNESVRDLQRALDWLRGQVGVDGGRLGAIGFCMGGSFALSLACVDDRVHAASVFYGRNPRPIATLARACPVVGSFPDRDFTTKESHVLEAELKRHGIAHDVKIYPNSKHSFFNDRGRAYNAEAAADAWQRTLSFFTEHLRPA